MNLSMLVSVAVIAALASPLYAAPGQVLVNRMWDPDGAGPKGVNNYTFRYAADGSLMDTFFGGSGDYNEPVIVYRPQDQRFYTSSGNTSTDLTYYDASAPAGGGAWNGTFTTWTPSTNTRKVAMTNPLLYGRDYYAGGCVDKDGNLYFVTPGSTTNGVVKVTFVGNVPTTVSVLITKANMPDPNNNKGYIAVDDAGNIYVSRYSSSTQHVSKYNPDGTLHTANFITGAQYDIDKGIVYYGGFLYETYSIYIHKYNITDGALVTSKWANNNTTGWLNTLATDGTYIYAAGWNGLYQWDLATATIATNNPAHGEVKNRGLAVQSPAPVVVPKGTVVLII
ncbi:MAG: hypothetical protein WCI17_03095 [bacterium]